MTSVTLNERMRVSIELALIPEGGDPSLFPPRYADAKRLGMSDAEIDIAREGRSFDVQTSSAQAVAIASLAGDETRYQKECAKALVLGLGEEMCRRIEELARCFACSLKNRAAPRA